MKKFSRILSMVLAVALVVGLLPVVAPVVVVASETPTGYGSNGKFLAPIEDHVADSIPISTRAELEAIANNLSGNYHLMQDIDLSGEEWVPIGDNSTNSLESRFMGTFDGQGYIIKNMTITSSNYGGNGLFGNSYSASIKNVGIENSTINIVLNANTSYSTGILCGSFANGSINNCYTAGAVTVSSAHGRIIAGGLCGYNSASINDCYNSGSVTAFTTGYSLNDSVYAGGICGVGNDLVSNCSNTGVISASSYSAYAGGVCGYIGLNSSGGSVVNCYNIGDVSAIASINSPTKTLYRGMEACAGGISGSNGGPIDDCSNVGSVSAYMNILVIPMYAFDFDTYAGGISGRAYSSLTGVDLAINRCSNMGNVKSSANYTDMDSSDPTDFMHFYISYAGGICGAGKSINNCLNMGDIVASVITTPQDKELRFPGILTARSGGICGTASAINNSYNTGNISGFLTSASHSNPTSIEKHLYIGGICGYEDAGLIINSYCLNLYDNTEGTQLTTEQMKDASNFVGFDFENVWDIDPAVNDGYPFLRGMASGGGDPGDNPGDGQNFTPERIEKVSFTANTGKDNNGVASDVRFEGLDINYDDEHFKQSSYTYNHELARTSLALAMSAFNSAEAGNSGDYSADIAGDNVGRLLTNTHFNNIDIFSYEGCPTDNSIAVAFGSKPSWDGSTLIAVAVRGGAYEREWISNFNISGNRQFHDGFQNAANQVYDKLCSYINVHNISGRVKVWIVGYSRGAATANLVAARLDDGELPRHVQENIMLMNNDIYAYTFETPQNTKKLRAHDDIYRNIFNIINPIDFVTKVAMSGWGYTRYGSDVVLPAAETTSTYKDKINEVLSLYNTFVGLRNGKETMTWLPTLNIQAERLDTLMTGLCLLGYGSDKNHVSQTLLSAIRANLSAIMGTGVDSDYLFGALLLADAGALGIVLGESVITLNPAWKDILWASDWLVAGGIEKVPYAHHPELCLAWMLSLDGTEQHSVGYRKVFVACPVDVEVYDSQGILVAKVKNDVFTAENGSYIGGFVYDNEYGEIEKVFALPSDEEYTIRILATADGTMTYGISEIDVTTGSEARIVAYDDIVIKEGDDFTGSIENLDDETPVYALTIVDGETLTPTRTSETAVVSDKNDLTWEAIKNENNFTNAVTGDLILPAKGVAGSTITWDSSNETTVDISGIVTCPVSGANNESVTLTATISMGDASDTVVFNLTVLAQPDTPDTALDLTVSPNIGADGDSLIWDSTNKILTLGSYSCNTTADVALKVPDGTTIILAGSNSITSGGAGIVCDGKITFQGDGSLRIDADGDALSADDVEVSDDVQLIIISTNAYGLNLTGDFKMSGGTIDAIGKTNAARIEGDIIGAVSVIGCPYGQGMAQFATVFSGTPKVSVGKDDGLDYYIVKFETVDSGLYFVPDEGLYEMTGEAYDDNGTWSCDGNTLTLSGFDFTADSAAALYLPENTTIRLTGTNTIENNQSGYANGIQCDGHLTIIGNGTLNVSASGCAVNAKDGFALTDASVTASGGESALAMNGDFNMESGVLNLTASGSVLFVDGDFNMSGGELTTSGHYGINVMLGIDAISEGISERTFTITGGTIHAVGANNAMWHPFTEGYSVMLQNTVVTGGTTIMGNDGTGAYNVQGQFAPLTTDSNYNSATTQTIMKTDGTLIKDAIITPGSVSAVASPVISPNGGSFTGSQSVSISCATDGAAIHYTTDGSTPTTSSPLYTAPFTIAATTTVKAIAVKAGMTNSSVATVIFTKQSSSPSEPSNPGSSSGGSATTTPSVSSKAVDIEVNGHIVQATIDSDGMMIITYTAADITKYKSDNGEFVIEINGQNSIQINIPIAALGNDDLIIKTDFGTLTIPNSVLKKLGDTLRLVINKGSFTIALLDEKGKEIVYNDPTNPLILTLPYNLENGQNPNAVVAIDKDGEIIPFAVYKDGILTFDMAATGKYDAIYNQKAFPDTNGHWAADYIDFVAARGLYAGNKKGEFTPNGAMTRAMFCQVLANLEGVDLSAYKTSRFTDVATGAWYAAAVEWAADKGIVSGTGNGEFAPEQSITREQMAVMLNNYIKHKNFSLPTSSASAIFADEEKISAWALDAVKAIQSAGIISGKPGNTYDPKANATRAEVATIFARLIKAIAP